MLNGELRRCVMPMPIRHEIRTEALTYVSAHLIDEPGVRNGFSFIHEADLVDLIVLELRSARYIYRLMEMLDLKDTFSHPFCKFQVVQYAGVFEAAIDHLVFDRKYANTKLASEVENLRSKMESHETLAAVSGLAANARLSVAGVEAQIAIVKKSRKPRINIRFEERLAACNELGLVDDKLSAEILDIYKKRHSVHLSAKLKSAITIELSDGKRGFRRINGFCENVKRGLSMHGEPI